MILRGWVNKTTGETKLAEHNHNFKELAFSGIHCINSAIFGKIKEQEILHNGRIPRFDV